MTDSLSTLISSKLKLSKRYAEFIQDMNKSATLALESEPDEAVKIAVDKFGLKKNPDGFYLLNANKKLQKDLPSGAKHDSLLGLELLPASWTLDISLNNYSFEPKSLNICPKAGLCALKNNCLVFSSPYTNAMSKRSRRKKFMLEHPKEFLKVLFLDINFAFEKFRKPAFRLNVFSDILWEHILPTPIKKKLGGNIYDYTKIKNRMDIFPKGFEYSLTYSFHEKDKREEIPFLAKKFKSVAVVFPKGDPRPESIEGVKVVDGDKHDYRLSDNHFIVALTAKASLASKKGSGSPMLFQKTENK